MKTEILPFNKLGSIAGTNGFKKARSLFDNLFIKGNLIFLPLAFLLGRASLAAGLMPFGLAIYAVTMGMDVNRLLIAAAVILGMLTRGAAEQVYITAAAMLLYNAFNIPFRKPNPNPTLRYAIIGMVSVIIPQLVTVYLQGFLLYDLLKALLHAFLVFTLVFIFRNSAGILAGNHNKAGLSNEQVISLSIIVALAVSGMADINIFSFNIRNIICVLIILLFSFRYGMGVGAATGVTAGLVVSMTSTVTPMVIASYAFCGLLAGVLRGLGKTGAGLGFIMGNALLTLYINGSTDVLVYLNEIVAGIVIFMIIPRKYSDMLVENFDNGSGAGLDKKAYSMRIRELTVEKLNKFSMAFKELSKTFNEISETKVVTDKQDITSLFDRVADKVCRDCSLCMHCWDRNFYNTYQVLFKIVEKIDSKGRIDESDIPKYFLKRCERVHDFVQAVNNIFEIFKVDMVWRNKVGESRGLVSQQLEGLSGIISNLASEIDIDVNFKSEFEDALSIGLKKLGIKVSEVVVYENKWGKYEVSILHKGCGGKRNCVSAIEKAVSSIVGREMYKEESECSLKPKSGTCCIRLLEKESLRITTGMARMSKYDGIASGDSHTFMHTGDGKYIAALSDGMGTGQKAFVQSRATISLLEQFMESGFDKDIAVKLINSIFVLKSSDETFSTIDLSVIDLFSGEVEFVKIGAVSTFIKRDDSVDLIKSVSLPVGILSNVELELVHKKVKSGDFIIMMTDGVVDSFKGYEDAEGELRALINGIRSRNPQEIADLIMDEAYKNCNSVPIDDMTVLVAKIWEGI